MATHSEEIFVSNVQSVYLGNTQIPNPIIFMEIDGVKIGGGYVLQELGMSRRHVFVEIKANGDVYLNAISQVYENALTDITCTVAVHICQ